MYYLTAVISGMSKMPSTAQYIGFQNALRSRLLAIKNACEELNEESRILKTLLPINDSDILKIVIAPEYFFAPASVTYVPQQQSTTFQYLTFAQFLIVRTNLLNISKLYPDILIIPGTAPYKKAYVIPSMKNPTIHGGAPLTHNEELCEEILWLCLQTAEHMRFGIHNQPILEILFTRLRECLNELPDKETMETISLDDIFLNPSPTFKKLQERRCRHHAHQTTPDALSSKQHPRYYVDPFTQDALFAKLNDSSIGLTTNINPVTYRSAVVAYFTGQIAYNGTKNLGYQEINPRKLGINTQYLHAYIPKNKGFAWRANNIFEISHTILGIEICYDYVIGVLKKQTSDTHTDLDVHLTLSDTTPNNLANIAGEFFIHASSFVTRTGVRHAPSQANEQKFLQVKWSKFSYTDLIKKFSQKEPRPSKFFEEDEKYIVLFTRSCNNLPNHLAPPVCNAVGTRYFLNVLFDEWNNIQPDQSGELLYGLAEQ